MNYDVITIGDLAKDLFIMPNNADTLRGKPGEVNLCFTHGSKILVKEFHEDIGGSACNVAVGLSKLGFNTSVIGALGDDSEATKIKQRLDDENVDLSNLKIFHENKTNFSVVIVYKAERTIFVYRGLDDYSKLKIPKSAGRRTKWLYLAPVNSNFKTNYKDIISLVSEKNIKLTINPSTSQIKEDREGLKKLIYVSNILILNKNEAIDLTKISGFPTIKDLLKRLKSLGSEIVVVTDGKNGAYATDGENFYGIKSYPQEEVDVTGAGDAFSSGFLANYLKNKDLKEALQWGIMNSSQVVTDYGAQTGLLTQEKMQKVIEKSPGIYTL